MTNRTANYYHAMAGGHRGPPCTTTDDVPSLPRISWGLFYGYRGVNSTVIVGSIALKVSWNPIGKIKILRRESYYPT